MKIVFIISLIFLSLNAKNIDIIKVGYLLKKNQHYEQQSLVIVNIIEKQSNKLFKNQKFEMIRYYSMNELKKDYSNYEIDAIVFKSLDYFNEKNYFDSRTKAQWAASLGSKKFEKYYLIKNRQHEINLKNLKDTKVVLRDVLTNSQFWFYSLLNKANNKNYKQIKENIEFTKKDYELATSVFFNKNHISVIEEEAYERIVELNPQIKQKIAIEAISPEVFVSGLFFLRDNPKRKDLFMKIKKSFIKFNNKFKGTAFKSMTNAKIEPINQKHLMPYFKLYKKNRNYPLVKSELK